MAAHETMDTATVEQCFLCDPCRDMISWTANGASEVELSEMESELIGK
jgi:hypothetical protein